MAGQTAETAESLKQLDAALAALARQDAGLRLRLGQVLEVLGRGAHHLELGFSSLGAYALERCERSVRWVEGARGLARRLEALPQLRRAVASGAVSWSMGELVARVARPGTEAHWLEAARHHTVRQMRERLRQLGREGEPPVADAEEAPGEAEEQGPLASYAELDSVTLQCTVDREEAWLFEATRTLLEQLGERGAEAQLQALLAEGQGTLLAALPAGAVEGEALAMGAAQERWRQQLERWRLEAEERCERHWQAGGQGGELVPDVSGIGRAASLGAASLEGRSAAALDALVRELSRELSRHELELSRALLRFHRADGFRRLGYASEAQYARERLGLSRSSLQARRALALRLERLPQVAEALGAAHLGVEAALQLVRVATPRTEQAWVARARRRTLKHLREEVAAALTALRLSGEADCPPPADAELEAYAELERAVVSSEVCRGGHSVAPVLPLPPARQGEGDAEPASESRRAWFVSLASLQRWLEGGLQGSAAPERRRASKLGRSAGRVALRWHVSRATAAWWRALEAQAHPWLPRGMSWLKFLCLSLWQAWHHLLGTRGPYGPLYVRDRHRCRSPVCSRQDVTPHHLRYRSAGGSDAPENLAAVCTWCHLFGIHGGRIRAHGTAERIRWELGAPGGPCLVVDGRERLAA